MSPAKFHDDFDHQRSITNMIRQINGPRPSPLKINKDAHVIRKLSSLSNSLLLAHNNKQQQQQKQPVIIYAHSPKIIHTQPRDFMALVQKLTGRDNDDHGHETAPTQAQETNTQTMQKPMLKASHDHDNDSSSVVTDDQKRGGRGIGVGVGDCGVTKPSANPLLGDMPLFIPTSTDNLFCSPRPMFRFPESMYASPISPSLIEFMKGLPEY